MAYTNNNVKLELVLDQRLQLNNYKRQRIY